MKIILTESQYKNLIQNSLNEDTVVKLGCNDFNKIGEYCGKLKITEQEAQSLIEKGRQVIFTELNEGLDKLFTEVREKIYYSQDVDSKEIKSNVVYNKLYRKIEETISSSKPEVLKICEKYYPSVIMESAGYGKVNTTQFVNEILNVYFTKFKNMWDNLDFITRKIADVAVDEDNIEKLLKKTKEVFIIVVDSVGNLIHYNIGLEVGVIVRDYGYQKSKNNPTLCKKVVVTQDEVCNNIKPYNPIIRYSYEIPLYETDWETIKSNFLPKIETMIRSLV